MLLMSHMQLWPSLSPDSGTSFGLVTSSILGNQDGMETVKRLLLTYPSPPLANAAGAHPSLLSAS